jgi:asparagine synthase (glutamine-hydrolysing)
MIPLTYVAFLARRSTKRSERLVAFLESLVRDEKMAIIHDSSTLLVAADPALPRIELSNGRGTLLGYVFDRRTGTRLTAPFAGEESPAGVLAELIWGGYLALRTCNDTPEVFREPSGTLPCYHAEIDDTHIVTSRPDLLVSAGLVRPEPDWTILAQGLVYRDLKPARTAMRDIGEILPGIAARIFPTGIDTRCAWSPWTFAARATAKRDFIAAADRVGEALDLCLPAWAGCFERPLTEISGGLDSAIVTAGAAPGAPNLTGITYAAIDGDPDETPYARAVAEHIGIALEVVHPESGGVDISNSDAAALPRPYSRIFGRPFDQAARRVGAMLQADAFFSGGGGDNVFSYQRSLSPAIDRIRATGWGLRLGHDRESRGARRDERLAHRAARRAADDAPDSTAVAPSALFS